jgi:hypothetical protein
MALCLWSIASSLTRPTSFDALINEVAEAQKSNGLSVEGRQKIDARIEELRHAHESEVYVCSTAWHIALGGLLSMSLGIFVLFCSTHRKIKTVQLNELQQLAAQRLERLRGLSVADLRGLSEFREEVERIGKRKFRLTTYRDVLPDGRLRIMIQVYLHRFLGMGRMTADGFIVASDGTQSSVPQEMVWEFT